MKFIMILLLMFLLLFIYCSCVVAGRSDNMSLK